MIVIIPELLFLLGILHLLLLRKKFSTLDSKKVFNITKGYLIASFISALIIYNHHISIDFLSQNPRLMLIKTSVYIYSLIWIWLSSRWFANKNLNGINFAILALIQIFAILLLISAKSLVFIGVLLTLLYSTSYFLFALKTEEELKEDINSYKKTSVFMVILFWIGLFFINTNPSIAFVLMMPSAFYLAGIAPFHRGFVDIVSKSILPVSGLCSSINILGYLVLINFLAKRVFDNVEISGQVLQIFGIFGLFIGALYANQQTNLRKVLAYSSVFHTGIIIVLLSLSSSVAVYIYLLIYSISMFGLFSTFYGIKLNGEYQKEIYNLYGIGHNKPFIISCLMIFLLSLMGYPPIIGFAGRISIVETLLAGKHYLYASLFMAALMVLISAYLKIIKAFYFTEAKNKKYDRVDFGVYLVLTIYVVFLIATLLSPSLLTQYLQEVFYK